MIKESWTEDWGNGLKVHGVVDVAPDCFGEHYKITSEFNKCHSCPNFQVCVSASIDKEGLK